MRQFAYYVLNPLHIIQCLGAFGVCIFFITSGYLTMPQIGTKRYLQRFFKQIVGIMIDVIVAMMFCMLLSVGFEYIFESINGYQSFYLQYSITDWISTGFLIRNVLYLESTEGVLWFLIPFLLFKLFTLIYDMLSTRLDKREEKCVWFFYGFTIVGYLVKCMIPYAFYLTERFFYIRIIMIGYIFALLHKGKIDKRRFVLL